MNQAVQNMYGNIFKSANTHSPNHLRNLENELAQVNELTTNAARIGDRTFGLYAQFERLYTIIPLYSGALVVGGMSQNPRQLPEHPLDKIGADVVLGAAEVAECVTTLGLCYAEDAAIQAAEQGTASAGDAAGKKLNQAFEQVEDFAAQGLNEALKPSTWITGP